MENTPTVLRGKATRAFVMTVVLIWAVPAHGRAAVPAESVGPAGQALDAYIQQLDSVIKELREVGTLLREEKYEEARELLRKIREQASGKLDQSRENQLVRSIPNPRSGGWEHWKHHELFKWFTRAEAPDLALEEYRKAEEAGVTVDLEHKLAKTECLIRTGQYAQAAAELKQLLASDVPSDWERIHTRRIEALEELTDGVPLDTETIRRLYVAPGRNWYMRDIFPVLVAWNAPDRNKNAQAAGEVLLALMERSGDRQGQKLTCLWVAENQAVSQESAGEALVKAGNLEYELKDYETARQFWRRADKEYRDTAAWAKAVFNIGLSYKDEGKYSEAIAEFERILTADVDDMEPGAHIMETYRNYRPRAQWEIGLCHLAASKHAEALDAFVTGREKYPFKSWCGNCQDAFEYRYAFYEGLCHEYLGQWHKAVCRYFDAATVELYSNATVHVRLVDLYERAGQLDDLVSILDSWDKPQIAKYGEKAHLSSSIMRKIRQLRNLEEQARWDDLVSYVRQKGTVAGPQEYRVRVDNWEATEAVRLLARHPETAVPLLLKKLGHLNSHDAKWVFYALGACGTPEALERLEKHARTEENCYVLASVVFAISAAGTDGLAVLDRLAAESAVSANLIARAKSGELGEVTQEIQFPQIPEDVRLPVRIP